MLEQLTGDVVELLCSDEVVPVRDGKERFEAASLTEETSRAINASGQPPSLLRQKVQCPLWCVRPFTCVGAVGNSWLRGLLHCITSQCSSTHCTQLRRRLCLTTNVFAGLYALLLRHSDLQFVVIARMRHS